MPAECTLPWGHHVVAGTCGPVPNHEGRFSCVLVQQQAGTGQHHVNAMSREGVLLALFSMTGIMHHLGALADMKSCAWVCAGNFCHELYGSLLCISIHSLSVHISVAVPAG